MIPKLNIDFSLSKTLESFVPWVRGQVYPICADNAFFLNHARTGLRIALSSLNIPVGSRIGVSMYNCLTVMNAVRVAGFEIDFLDITNDLKLDLDDLKRKSRNLSAIIVTHFYGIANDIEAIKSIAQNIPIIEDCAHAYGSLNEDGTLVGAKGDFAVFSTGLGKFPSIGDGGILIVNNKSYLNSVSNIVTSLCRYGFVDELVMIIKGFAKHIAYRPFIYSVLLPFKKKKQECGSFTEMYQHTEAIMPRYVYYHFDKELSKTDDRKKAQQEISYRLTNLLSDVEGVYVPKYDNKLRNGFLFPIIVEREDRLIENKSLSRFEITGHFAKSVIWAKQFGYKGDCQNAEKVAKKIIVLACNYYLDNHSK